MKTYQQLREKTLTTAEKRKREEIAKAIDRENPNMPMDKKMAIATSQAKKVAESEEVNELSQDVKNRYLRKSMDSHTHASAVARDAEGQGNKKTADKYRKIMKKRNQGMARAMGQTKDTW